MNDYPFKNKRASGCSLGFISGMSRSGTTWLAMCLNLHPEIAVFGETMYWGRKYVKPSPSGYYSESQVRYILDLLKTRRGLREFLWDKEGCLKNVGLDNWAEVVELSVREPNCSLTPKQLFSNLCQVIANFEGSSLVVEKTPHHINYLNRIHHAYPDAKFIIMWRDVYEFALSFKHMIDGEPDAIRKSLAKRGHPLARAWAWRGFALSLIKAHDNYDKNTLFICYKDVSDTPETVLSKAMDFLGVRQEDIMLPRQRTSFPSGVRSSLEPEDIFWINVICRKTMKKLGIKIRPYNFAPFRIFISVIKLPLWLFYYCTALPQTLTASPIAYVYHWIRAGFRRTN